MSLFGKVTSAMDAEAAKKAEAVAFAIAQKNQLENQFEVDFLKAIENVAIPRFEAFVEDAKAHGYDASFRRFDSVEMKSLVLRLMPEKNRQLSPQTNSEEVSLAIRGTKKKQNVEFATYFDQRTQRHSSGERKENFGVAAINDVKLGTLLEKFLTDSLKARAE